MDNMPTLSKICPDCDGKGERDDWCFGERIHIRCSWCNGFGRKLTEEGQHLADTLRLIRQIENT